MRLAFRDKELCFKEVIPLNPDSLKQNTKFIRIATCADSVYLEKFHKSVYALGDFSAKVYAKLATEGGRTYIFDASENEPFIVSAITVATTIDGEKHFLLGGTVPSLRKNGFFTSLLNYTLSREESDFGGKNAVCFPKTEKDFHFLQKRGFIYQAEAFECSIKGNLSKKSKFHTGYFAGADYKLCRKSIMGDNGFSFPTFSLLYEYYRSKNGIHAMTADGFIAFSPVIRDEDAKGKYNIDECAISVKEINNLSPAFEKCLVPLCKEEELKANKIHYEKVITALTNFPTNGRYINGVQRY